MRVFKVLMTVAGAAVGVGVAVVAAPVVLPMLGAAGVLGVAGTGTAISTLSGAALASASGAAITGTVAGTTAVIAGGTAVAGGVVGNKVADKMNS